MSFCYYHIAKCNIYLTFKISYDTLWVEVINCMKNIKMKLARIENDLTQEQLAKSIEVTRQTIGLIEAGKYNPSLSLCITICKKLNKTLNDLFWEV